MCITGNNTEKGRQGQKTGHTQRHAQQ
jgi:hypothetical protein